MDEVKVSARLPVETMQALRRLAYRQGMILPGGQANISAAIRCAVDLAVTATEERENKLEVNCEQRTA